LSRAGNELTSLFHLRQKKRFRRGIEFSGKDSSRVSFIDVESLKVIGNFREKLCITRFSLNCRVNFINTEAGIQVRERSNRRPDLRLVNDKDEHNLI
jgi:hypothetical protein